MSEPDKPPSAALGETGAWSDALAAASAAPLDLTGRTVGDFSVERLLGRGGMGEVYLARQISLNRPVALKVLRSELLSKPAYLGRFEAEATAAAKLNHPNIVHIYMMGCVDKIRFIAMEYVQGTNLRDYILKKGALDLPLALSIMKQTGIAVGVAGEHGLVHRDIKPENILLTRKGQLKVADFGLCRDLDADLHHTQPGMTLGTPLYMSPEQAQGHTLDHRSDLYSLGVSFYQMLAGAPPFRAETALALALKHIKEMPVSLAVHRPDLPPDLVRLVMKLMEKSPADRYQSAAEMLGDLARIKATVQAPTAALPVADFATSLPTMPNGLASAPRVGTPAVGAQVAGLVRWASGLRVGGPMLAAPVALCLLAGLAWGWAARPPDLLAESSASAAALPALWMAPEWSAIPRLKGAEEQYHFAQVRAASEDREAAWLAVPGYFPEERDWAARAYTQLARSLLKRHDAERLRVLASEIARWGRSQANETKLEKLADVIGAGARALVGDLDGVLETFQTKANPASIDYPSLLELSFEVTLQAARAAERDPESALARSKLGAVQDRLLTQLFMAETQELVGWRKSG